MDNEIRNIRNKIVKLALLQHKKKYVHGSNGPKDFDCAGLVYYVYKEILGVNVYEDGIGKSTTTKIMTNKKGDLIKIKEDYEEKDEIIDTMQKGDIVFMHRQSLKAKTPKETNKYPGHCGIYIGNGKMIHATKSKGSVVISDLKKTKKWKKVLVGYKNML